MEYTVNDHFKDKEPILAEIYSRLITECEKFGPVRQSPKKTSIHLDSRAGFAGVYTRKNYILLHVHTDYHIDSNRIDKMQQLSKRRFKHTIKLTNPADIDKELIEWLKDAYDLKK